MTEQLAEHTEARPAERRQPLWLRLVKLAAFVGIVAWVGRGAYLRVVTPPALSPEAYMSMYATPEQVNAANALNGITSPLRKFGDAEDSTLLVQSAFVPGPNWRRLLTGDWPATDDEEFTRLVALLETPPVQDALETLRTIAEPNGPSAPIDCGNDFGGLYFTALLADARYARETHGDVRRAWRDIKAVMRVDGAGPQRWTSLFGGPALDELEHMLFAASAPPDVIEDILAELDRAPAPADAWESFVGDYAKDCRQKIDACYTRNSDGDGWLVLSAATNASSEYRNSRRSECSPWCNLMSPLFSSRRTAEAKLSRLIEVAGAMRSLTHAELTALWTGTPETYGSSRLEGPLLDRLSLTMDRVAGLRMKLNRDDAQRAAIRIMAALNRCRTERGAYPESLNELVPEYLDMLPTDICADAPFRYARSSPDAYELLSAHPFSRLGEEDCRHPGPRSQPENPYGPYRFGGVR